MRLRLVQLATVLCLAAPLPPRLVAQPPRPILQLEAGGPTAQVTSLAFAHDGKRLYAAGYDKVVRVWARDKSGRFSLDNAFRVPIGPGADGAINTLAVSGDGRWLAAAGLGVMREAAGYRQSGIIEPRAGRLTTEMLEDQGAVYVFDTAGKNNVRVLRGHRGTVLALAFAPASPGKPAVLVSFAREGDTREVGVLRLWDVAGAKPLARSKPTADPGHGRPGLAVWHSGNAPRQVSAALACVDQPLQLWQASSNQITPHGKKKMRNDTALFVPNRNDSRRGTLLTGYFEPPGARLQSWQVSGTGELTPLADEPAPLAEDGAPHAVALVPGGGAMVVQMRNKTPAPDSAYRLVLFGLNQGRAESVGTSASLWRSTSKPVLAASPDGLLAVAGGPSLEIAVFAASKNLARPLRVLQRLRSDGQFIQKAEFVRRGKDRGLRLVEQTPGKAASRRTLVFDFAERRLIPAANDWKADSPAGLDDWKVTPTRGAGGQVSFTVNRAGAAGVTTRLKPSQTATAYAFLPPCQPLQTPLLAVGYVERGVSYLALYDARRGRPLRLFTGHLSAIGSLAFDADGRLLVSTAEDKTVCVWSLTDLGETLGRRGMVRGLAVKQGAAGLQIAELDKSDLSAANQKALAAAKIEPEDVIDRAEGLPARALASPHAFYEALWQLAPRSAVTLRVKGGATAKLTLDQGVDERKPLFSLFVIGGAKAQWLAWNPNGPYDTAPGIASEDRMGWHVNPDPAKPGDPVEFSNAARHRKEYRREGIVPFLVKQGNLAGALDAWQKEPAARPGLSLEINEVGPDAPRDRLGYPVIQDGRVNLCAAVYGVPMAKVARVQWQFDGGKRRDFDEYGEHTQSASLQDLPWTRGLHEIRLWVTTVQATPAEYSETIQVHYRPRPPAVQFSDAWLKKTFGDPVPARLRVRQPNLTVEATVAPGDNLPKGEQVEVSVRHQGKSDVVPADAVRKQVTLLPGVNVLEVVARNKGAAADSADEATAKRLVVYYDPIIPPPTLTVESVEAAPDPKVALPVPGQVLTVRVPAVKVRVEVRAGEPLTSVTLDDKPAAGFDPKGKAKSFLLEQTVRLKPGRRKLTFAAQTRTTRPVSQSLTLDYQPELPQLEATESRSVERAAGDPLDFPFQVRLEELKHPYPFTATVQANGGKEVPAAVEEGRLARCTVRLRPGENRLVVVLKNAYRQRTEEFRVYVKRPPRLLAVQKAALATRPVADLSFEAQTPKGLPLAGVSVDGQEVEPERWSLVPDRARPEVATVTVKDVLLLPGNNTFTLRARNRDGGSDPGTVVVRYQEPKQPPSPARAEIVDPRTDLVVGEPRCRLTFRVYSLSQAQVRVLRDSEQLAVAKPRKEGDALVYQMEVSDLQPGPNILRVEVSNAAGPMKDPPRCVVNYTVPWSIRLNLTRLERADKSGEFLPLTETVPTGAVRLHGEVEWRQANDPALRLPASVRVWVNDFEQLSVPLGAAQGQRRPFTAQLRLSQAQNLVELRLPPRLKLDSDKPVQLSLQCGRPEKKQRLHLIIVGPGQKDQKKLTADVLKGFLATNVRGARFQTPAFEEGVVYGPLPADVSRQKVETLLLWLKRRLRFSSDNYNDVVVVFFSGEEVMQDKKLYLLTEESQRLRRVKGSAIDAEALSQILSDCRGAKLLLLDTKRQSRGLSAGDLPEGEGRRLGIYRYVWLGSKDAPEQARLVYALEQSLSRAPLLGEQKPLLTSWASKLGEDASFELSYPPGLRFLRLGKADRE